MKCFSRSRRSPLRLLTSVLKEVAQSSSAFTHLVTAPSLRCFVMTPSLPAPTHKNHQFKQTIGKPQIFSPSFSLFGMNKLPLRFILQDRESVAAILFLGHRWEEVEKQSFRVKGLELSAGQRRRRSSLYTEISIDVCVEQNESILQANITNWAEPSSSSHVFFNKSV